MRKILIPALFAVSTGALAQISTSEEAIILNQELQFLEDSVQNIQSVSVNTNTATPVEKALNEKSLERTYFGEDSGEDTVTTKTASPKRRGL